MPEGNGWLPRWAADYVRFFGLDPDADLKMVLSWAGVLGGLYTYVELCAAADWLLAHPEAFDKHKGRAERHLSALHRAVAEVRAVECKRAEQEAEDDHWGTCTLCGSTGYVVVPWLGHVVEGEWRPVKFGPTSRPTYRTCAVVCLCLLGPRRNAQREKPLLTLEQYQLRNPRWREQLARRHAEQQAEAELRHGGERLDGLARRLAERYGVKED